MPRWSIVRWLSLENRSTCPFAPLHGSHGNIYIYIEAEFLFFLSLSFFSPSKFSLSPSRIYHERALPKGGEDDEEKRIESNSIHGRSRVAGNALTHQKEIKRVSAAGLSLFRCSATIVETRKENEEKGEVHKVIRSLFIDSRHCTRIVMDGWMCFISSHATLLPSSTSLRGKKGGRGEGTEQEKWRAEGEKSRGGTR